ncbi:tail fiber domain-containing protein [Aquabacterium sp. OR-4]|uniref:tail fiber domain-containing protein n=1 Tax=Aquabacterium sp. OR-4 TaxID=2978127 RepID=UPI0021B4846D|nr:tail fiber domain-containing protein [Aquabacterium sp. OR-4]MDT7836450.1 tail fiber domain-containing protein [Aquabacterium sp. OR-4]
MTAELYGFAANLISHVGGEVSIGTSDVSTTPQGFAWVLNAGGSYSRTGHASGTGAGTAYAVWQYAGGVIGSITQSGTTGVLYNTTSDERLKTSITAAGEAGATLDAVQVRRFHWRADGALTRWGFVAQELVQVLPEAVHQPINPDEMMGVDYSKLVPLLVAEVQALRRRVAALEAGGA